MEWNYDVGCMWDKVRENELYDLLIFLLCIIINGQDHKYNSFALYSKNLKMSDFS